MTGLQYALATRADELLGDGQWHNYEKTIRALLRLVPPGRAMRRNEMDRVANRKTQGKSADIARKRPATAQQRIYSGARSITRDFLTTGAFETNRKGQPNHADNERQIRQVHQHRALEANRDPLRVQRDRFEAEAMQLREYVDRLEGYLKDNGHADAIDRLKAGDESPP